MIDLSPHKPLILELIKHFQPVPVTPRMSQSEIMFLAGQQYIIKWLLETYHKQQDEEIPHHVHITPQDTDNRTT